jgi:hypothetical protein
MRTLPMMLSMWSHVELVTTYRYCKNTGVTPPEYCASSECLGLQTEPTRYFGHSSYATLSQQSKHATLLFWFRIQAFLLESRSWRCVKTLVNNPTSPRVGKPVRFIFPSQCGRWITSLSFRVLPTLISAISCTQHKQSHAASP